MSSSDRVIASCQVNGGTVYIRDQRGALIDVLSFPVSVQAQSFGNGVSIISGTMCYTYMLENGSLRQTGIHAV
jgi:hypothetical protein